MYKPTKPNILPLEPQQYYEDTYQIGRFSILKRHQDKTGKKLLVE